MGLREVEGVAQGHRAEQELEASSLVSPSCALGLLFSDGQSGEYDELLM